MAENDLHRRTRDFALRVIRMVHALPRGPVRDVLGKQALRSGSAIGANYHEASHASSRRHFITLLEISQREARETSYWLRLIAECGEVKPTQLASLQDECHQLLAMLTACIKTAKRKPNDTA
jgi:four helix bundle protein